MSLSPPLKTAFLLYVFISRYRFGFIVLSAGFNSISLPYVARAHTHKRTAGTLTDAVSYETNPVSKQR